MKDAPEKLCRRVTMQNAFEYEVEYGKDGKCLKKRWLVGGIVVWAVVVIALCVAGHPILSIPASLTNNLWRSLLKR